MTPGSGKPVLADTSVWIDHLRRGNGALAAALDAGAVLVHEFVLGELMLGVLSRGGSGIRDLEAQGRAARASHEEVSALVRAHRLEGSGIGWIDAHLLASAAVSGAVLLTLDTSLARAAARVGVCA